MSSLPPILQVGDVLLSTDIITEKFCCNLAQCKGKCCIEGEAGAPVSMDEILTIEEVLDTVWNDLSASAQAVIDKQGVAYTDQEGDLVTSIVGGKDCVFTYEGDIEDPTTQQPIGHCCLCALEKAFRSGKTHFCKPSSCALYPIRAKRFSNGTIGLNYHQWDICQCARDKGRELDMPVYRFLEKPLVQRFGQEWYDELCSVAKSLSSDTFLD